MVWTQAPEGRTIEYMDRYQHQAEQCCDDARGGPHLLDHRARIGTPGLVNQGMCSPRSPIGGARPQPERDRRRVRRGARAIAGIKAPAQPVAVTASGLAGAIVIGPDLAQLSATAASSSGASAPRRLRERPDRPLSEQAAARGRDRPRPRERSRRLGARHRDDAADPARRRRPLHLQARRRDLRRDRPARARRARPTRASSTGSTSAGRPQLVRSRGQQVRETVAPGASRTSTASAPRRSPPASPRARRSVRPEAIARSRRASSPPARAFGDRRRRVGGLLRVGQRAPLRLPAGGRDRVPRAGGAVRELRPPVTILVAVALSFTGALVALLLDRAHASISSARSGS